MSEIHKAKPLTQFPSALAQQRSPVRSARGLLSGLLRLLVFGVVALALLSAGGLYYLSFGPVSSDQLKTRVSSVLAKMVGPGFVTDISKARISFGDDGLLSIAVEDVRLSDQENGSLIGKAGKVSVGLNLLSIFSKKYQVESVLVEDAVFDVGLLGLINRQQPKIWPNSLDIRDLLKQQAKNLNQLSATMDDAGLTNLSWRNVAITGLGSDDTSAEPADGIVIEKLEIVREPASGGLKIVARLIISALPIDLTGNWIKTDNGYSLQIQIDGLNANNFLAPAANSSQGAFGLDAAIALSYFHPFDKFLNPLQSTARIKISNGQMRFGRKNRVVFSGADINLRLLPGKNQLELEKSVVRFGASSAVLTGGIRFPLPNQLTARAGNTTTDDSSNLPRNLASPIFELIANDIVAAPSDSDEKPVRASFRITGRLEPENRLIVMDEITLMSENGNLIGAGSMGFGGASPSLALALSSSGFAVSNVKQLWPVFLASKVRAWVLKNIDEGTVESAHIDAAIPVGLLAGLRKGQKMTPEHLSIQVDVSGVTVRSPGDIPPISQARGRVLFQGMETRVKLEKAIMQLNSGGVINISNGLMTIGDYSIKPARATLAMDFSGDASDLLMASSQKPLSVASLINIDPSDLSGVASGSMKLAFPIKKKLAGSEIDWSTTIVTKNLAVGKGIEGYEIKKANVTITAKPGTATINGKANVNGVATTVSLVEHFGADNSKSPVRTIKLQLNAKARKKLGLELDSFLRGTILVSIDLADKDKPRRVRVDLTNAALILPWVNWSKGKGIRARAEFTMQTKEGKTSIDNLVLSGDGFVVAGKLRLDDKGLSTADLGRFNLNRGDSLQLRVKRTGGGYSIIARGASYDARAIIRQVIDRGNPKSSLTRKTRVKIDAKIDSVTGFGGEKLTDVTLFYDQKNDNLTRAILTGRQSDNSPTEISITPVGGLTKTTMRSLNAGSTLRFLDIYKRMKGGTLSAGFQQIGAGPHHGRVVIKNFYLADEPRLKRLLSVDTSNIDRDSREPLTLPSKPVAVNDDIKVNIVSADLIKDDSSLIIKNGVLRAGDVGSNFSGVVYDAAGNMDLKGTYLPGYGLNRLGGRIPLVGLAFGDGTERGLLGITYRLYGPAKNPNIQVNPISIMAPGIFRKIFEFK